jgi:hypothetical protein
VSAGHCLSQSAKPTAPGIPSFATPRG